VDELDDLRQLMWNARERWTTVKATVRERVDATRAEEAFDRFEAQESPGSVARFGPEIDLPPYLTKEVRVWARKPYRWRVETDQWNGDSYAEVGDRAWRSDLTYHGYGPEETEPPNLLPLDDLVAWVFDPRIALTELDVVGMAGSTEHARREAVMLVAMPGEDARRSHTGPLIPSVLGWGWIAHDFELLVDAERGVLLRSSALLGGLEFARFEVVEVAFDEDLPEDVLQTEESEWMGPAPGSTDTVPRPWRLEA
jgi:hypothetical protein